MLQHILNWAKTDTNWTEPVLQPANRPFQCRWQHRFIDRIQVINKIIHGWILKPGNAVWQTFGTKSTNTWKIGGHWAVVMLVGCWWWHELSFLTINMLSFLTNHPSSYTALIYCITIYWHGGLWYLSQWAKRAKIRIKSVWKWKIFLV